VTQFPELHDALVDAAARYHAPRRRTWRMVRLAVPVAAVAAVVALAVVIALPRTPDAETPAPAGPSSDALDRQFGVFRRAGTSDDVIPRSFRITGIPLQRDRGRLLGQVGDLRFFLVPTTRGGVCPLVFVGDRMTSGTCLSLKEAVGAPVGGTDRSDAVAWAFAEGLADVQVSLVDGTVLHPPIRDNAVVLRPGAPAVSLSWADRAGDRHGMLVEQRVCPRLDPLPADARERASVVAAAAARDLYGAADAQVTNVRAAPRNAGGCGRQTATRALVVDLSFDGVGASQSQGRLLVGRVDGAVTVFQQMH
jgi:hypothetical protein